MGKHSIDEGPVRQSERLDLYREHAEELIRGCAYRCFCSSCVLDEMRKSQQRRGLTSIMYDRRCMRLDPEEAAARTRRRAHTVRFHVPHGQTLVKDLVYGNLSFDNKTIDDQVLLKSDGFPTPTSPTSSMITI